MTKIKKMIPLLSYLRYYRKCPNLINYKGSFLFQKMNKTSIHMIKIRMKICNKICLYLMILNNIKIIASRINLNIFNQGIKIQDFYKYGNQKRINYFYITTKNLMVNGT